MLTAAVIILALVAGGIGLVGIVSLLPWLFWDGH